MSAMVLVFILVLFYILYKYFVIQDAYKAELDKMLVIEAALNDKEAELTTAQDALTSQQDALATAQGDLTDAQEELAKKQLMLNLAQQAPTAICCASKPLTPHYSPPCIRTTTCRNACNASTTFGSWTTNSVPA
jgi:hypothetical protein